MNILRWIIVAVGMVFFSLPAQAPADFTGPEMILYRFPGVRDDGSVARTGVATVFHCTNFSGVTETIRIVVRDADSGVLANTASSIAHLQTLTFSTHVTSPFAVAISVPTGPVAGGTAAIAATSTSMVCTSMILDAQATGPVGIALHGVRFDAALGSEE